MPKSTIYIGISTGFFLATQSADGLIEYFVFLGIQGVTGCMAVWFFSKELKGDK